MSYLLGELVRDLFHDMTRIALNTENDDYFHGSLRSMTKADAVPGSGPK